MLVNKLTTMLAREQPAGLAPDAAGVAVASALGVADGVADTDVDVITAGDVVAGEGVTGAPYAAVGSVLWADSAARAPGRVAGNGRAGPARIDKPQLARLRAMSPPARTVNRRRQ